MAPDESGRKEAPSASSRSRDGEGPGRLFIFSAPSGAGKTTLRQAVLARMPDMSYSVSHTTRNPREGEVEGVDYHFIDRDVFERGLNDNLWAEWAQVHDCFYGTSAQFLEKEMSAGHDVLLDIDVQGAAQIVARYPASVTVFIMPPSMAVLRERLESRGTDSEGEIAKRLHNAQAEIAQKDRYRHVVVNDELSETTAKLIGIIQQNRGGLKA